MAHILLSQKEVPADLLEYFEPVEVSQAKNTWAINPTAFPGAHYAVWPASLVAPMIEAGTSEQGVCAACGAPHERVVERKGGPQGDHLKHVAQTPYDRATRATGNNARAAGGTLSSRYAKEGYPTFTTTGFRPTCTCEAVAVPATVLDPFAGSATTCTEARRLGRRSIGIDLGFDEDVLKHRIEHAHHRTNGQLHVTPSALGTQPEADLGPLFSAP